MERILSLAVTHSIASTLTSGVYYFERRISDMPSTTFFSALLVVAALLLSTGCRSTSTSQPNSLPQTSTSSQSPATVSDVPPKFSGRIDNISLYPVPNNSKDLAISLVVIVSNSGSPALVQDWSLSLNCPTRNDLKTAKPVHVNGIVDMPPGAGGSVDLSKEDLVLKSQQAPLANGETLKGILTFVLTETSAAELSNNGSTLAIQFKDSRGGSYRTPIAIIGSKIQH
jgi:hypothetical protein